jgi:hypothetical protein
MSLAVGAHQFNLTKGEGGNPYNVVKRLAALKKKLHKA